MNNLVTSYSRSVIHSCLVLLVIISLIFLFKIFLINNYFDYTFYYLSLQAFIKGNNPYLLHIFPFPYPPLALILLLPFAFLPLLSSAKIFVCISLFCLFYSLFILFRLFKIPLYSNLCLILVILTCNYFPIKYSLAGGQINAIVLLFVSLFTKSIVKKQNRLAGISLAVAVSLKLFPILLFPYLFMIKKFSIIKSFLFSLLLISIVALIFIPLPVLYAYFNTTLPTFIHTGGGTYYFDQSLSAFIARSSNSLFAIQFSKPFAIIILGITYYILWRYRNTQTKLLGISILFILNILLGNFAWQHHFIWLIIPYIITLVYIKENRLHHKLYVVLGISYLLTAVNIPNPRLVPIIFQSHVFFGAVILYILLLYLILTSSKNISFRQTNLRNKLIPKQKTK